MAQSRAETLRYVTGATISTLDLTQPGSTRESFGLSMNVSDRLFSFSGKKPSQFWVFDADTITGELAQGISDAPPAEYARKMLAVISYVESNCVPELVF